MKASADTQAAVSAAIEPVDTPERRELYRSRRVPRAELVKDWDRRYRWDLFYGVYGRSLPYDVLDGLSDVHIDTLLQKIVAPL